MSSYDDLLDNARLNPTEVRDVIAKLYQCGGTDVRQCFHPSAQCQDVCQVHMRNLVFRLIDQPGGRSKFGFRLKLSTECTLRLSAGRSPQGGYRVDAHVSTLGRSGEEENPDAIRLITRGLNPQLASQVAGLLAWFDQPDQDEEPVWMADLEEPTEDNDNGRKGLQLSLYTNTSTGFDGLVSLVHGVVLAFHDVASIWVERERQSQPLTAYLANHWPEVAAVAGNDLYEEAFYRKNKRRAATGSEDAGGGKRARR